MPDRDVTERAMEALNGITPGLIFQHWGQQNQNGDYAESILFDAQGETLVYGLPDDYGQFFADAPQLVNDLLAEVVRLRERQESHDLVNKAIEWKRRALDAEAEVVRLRALLNPVEDWHGVVKGNNE